MRIDDRIGCRHCDQAARVVSLRDAAKLETPRFSLVILVSHTILLLVPFEDALTVGCRVRLAKACHCLIVTTSDELETLLLCNYVPVTISLTVNVLECSCQHLGLYERALMGAVKTARNARRNTLTPRSVIRAQGVGQSVVSLRRRGVTNGSARITRREERRGLIVGIINRALLLVLHCKKLPVIRIESLVHVALVRAIEELLGCGLTRQKLKALLSIHLLTNDLVPKSVILTVACSNHILTIFLFLIK